MRQGRGDRRGKVHSSLAWKGGPRSPPPAVATTPAKKLRLRHDRLVRVGGKAAFKRTRELVFEKNNWPPLTSRAEELVDARSAARHRREKRVREPLGGPTDDV